MLTRWCNTRAIGESTIKPAAHSAHIAHRAQPVQFLDSKFRELFSRWALRPPHQSETTGLSREIRGDFVARLLSCIEPRIHSAYSSPLAAAGSAARSRLIGSKLSPHGPEKDGNAVFRFSRCTTTDLVIKTVLGARTVAAVGNPRPRSFARCISISALKMRLGEFMVDDEGRSSRYRLAKNTNV